MRKSTIAKLVVIALVATAAVLIPLRARQPHPVALGDPAPAFTLPSLSQRNISLSQFHGAVVILNFWATWCPPCVEETPSLEKFAAEMRRRGAVVIGVSVDDDGTALTKFVKTYHLTYHIARDPNRALAARYGTFKFPETYIIDRDGRVAEKIIGPTDWSDPRMTTFVRALIGNGPVSER